jgi:hypothetical protein
MQVIIRIISHFIALFIIVTGIWVILIPPSGDEPFAYVIIAIGIIIPIIVEYVTHLDDMRDV